MLQLLYAKKKRAPVPTGQETGWVQSQSEHDSKEKNSHHCPCQELNCGHPACSLVSILTELYDMVYVNEIQWKIIYDFMLSNVCSMLSFVTLSLYLQ